MSHVLVGAVAEVSEEAPERFSLPRGYGDAIHRAGGQLVMLPPGAQPEPFIDAIAGLLLPGGGDIDPRRYDAPFAGQHYGIDPVRDETEFHLLQVALKLDRPIFGIGRGMQVLNVALGGTLIEHLVESDKATTHHRKAPGEPIAHEVNVERDSHLGHIIMAQKLEGLSMHHQAVDKLGKGLRAVAHAPDGVIEAIEHEERNNILGVQWNPETSAHTHPIQQNLFDWFVMRAGGGN